MRLMRFPLIGMLTIVSSALLAAQGTVGCLSILPGGFFLDGGQTYLVVSDGDGSAPADLKNPQILAQLVRDETHVCTSWITNMDGLFIPQQGWPAHYNPKIANWDTRQVHSMAGMFKDASDFDQDLHNWQTAEVTNMRQMFYGATAFSHSLHDWNVAKVTDHQDFATGSAIADDDSKLPQFPFTEMIKGTVRKALPEQTQMGYDYPFHFEFYNQTKDETATDLNFTTAPFWRLLSDGIELDIGASTCYHTHELAPQQACDWVGRFTPQQLEQQVTIDIQLNYTGGAPVYLTSGSQVTPIDVTSGITHELPAQLVQSRRYDFEFYFANESDWPLTDLWFDNHMLASDGVQVDTVNSSCYERQSLLPGDACRWLGTVTPYQLGALQISSSLHSLQSQPQMVDLSTEVIRLPTTAINDMPDAAADADQGWAWPSPRFTPLQLADGSSCSDALHDQLTGLIWLADGNSILNGSTLNHQQASDYVADLRLCGLEGWQLPSINQISSLINYNDDAQKPAAWLNSNGFHDIQTATYYWTDNPYSGSNYWYIQMNNGVVSYGAGPYYFLAMHAPLATAGSDAGAVIADVAAGGDQPASRWPEPRFTPAANAFGGICDQVLYDGLTGLMWLKDGSFNSTQPDAQTHVQDLVVCGYDDWRLPSINELRSLASFKTGVNSATWLNQQGFENIAASCYWTARSYNSSSQFRYVELDASPYVGSAAGTSYSLAVRSLPLPPWGH